MTHTISLDGFAPRHAAGATVVDVREADEYAAGHVPGAIFAPMSAITQYLADLPRGEDVFVICKSGRRSMAMADVMTAQGINAISVDGGTDGWVAAGHDVVTGTSAS